MIKQIVTIIFIITAVSAAVRRVEDPRRDFHSRIVNGTDANIEDYPFMVSVQDIDFGHSCGGSMVSARYVLTAAHCVAYFPFAQYYQIEYNSTDIERNGTHIEYVDRIIIHEEYDDWYLIHDISLLRLRNAIQVGGYIELPPHWVLTPHGTPVTLIGWGLNATGGIIQQTLQSVNIYVFGFEQCRSVHENDIYETNICAGVDGGGQGQCSGDSGGPLLINNTVQVGIVSWSMKPCTIAPYPGVFTQVAFYTDWIRYNANLPQSDL